MFTKSDIPEKNDNHSVNPCKHLQGTLFNDLTRDSIASNFVIDVYCRCLQILYQIAFFLYTANIYDQITMEL